MTDSDVNMDTSGDSSTSEMSADRQYLEQVKQQAQQLMTELGISSPAEIDTLLIPSEKDRKKHIHQLNRYNTLRDMSMQLIAMIADQRSIPVREVMEEMGVEEDPKEVKEIKDVNEGPRAKRIKS